MLKNINPLYAGIAVAVLCVVVYFVFFRGSSEGFSSGKRSIVLFFLPGCGFCTDMMPEWDKFEASQRNNPNIEVRKVDGSQNRQAAQEQGITGFPTIILFEEDGSKKVFDGDRTQEAFERFIQ